MADKNFEIRITTPADTTGVGKTKADLASLETQAIKTGAAVNRATGSGILPGRAEPSAAELERRFREGPIGGGGPSAPPPGPGGAGSIGGFAGAAIAATALYNTLSEISAEHERIEKEILKQNEGLNKQIGAWKEIAREARDAGDVTGLAEKMLPQLDAASAKLREVHAQELTWFQSIKESLLTVSTYVGSGGVEAWTPYTDNLQAAITAQEQFKQTVVASTGEMIQAAQSAEAAWARVQMRPLADGVAEYTARVAALKNILAGLDKSTEEGQRAFVDYGKMLDDATEKLKLLTTAQSKLTEESSKLEAELNKINFEKLAPEDQVKELTNDIYSASEKLRQLGIESGTVKDAFDATKGVTSAWAVEVREVALEMARLQGNVDKTNKSISDNAAKSAETSAKEKQRAAEAISAIQQATAIEKARLSGNDELAAKLERQRDLQQAINNLIAAGVSAEQAKALAIEHQNTKLAQQEAQQDAAAAKAAADGKSKHFDLSGRDITEDPFDSAGKLSRTHHSDLDELERGDRAFRKRFEPPGQRDRGPQDAGGKGDGEAAGALKETGDKVGGEAQKIEAAVKDMEGKIVGGLGQVSSAIQSAGANIEARFTAIEGEISNLWAAI
jgi:hypothetical protein